MDEFENSFKGLINIIKERKLHCKKPYYISFVVILLGNILFYFYKSNITNMDYYEILKIFVNIFSPAFVTFCGFTMTAYSLVVGFLNYGVFKPTIERWYKLKILSTKGYIDGEIAKYSLYQNGIALFALAIILLLFSVVYFLVIRFVIDLNVEFDCKFLEISNAIVLFFGITFSWFSLLLMFFNILNIFTFSQALNQAVYWDELGKINLEEKKQQENKKSE